MDARRIIDANLNRAREALRVMEDAARFVLEDATLTARIKSARHGLRSLADDAGLDALGLAGWRDTPGDVGTGLTGSGERQRATIASVVVAAGKRAGEALRVLEEAAKLLPGGHAPHGADVRAKALRYEVYEIERRLVLAMGSGRARQWRLCVLITESACAHMSWEAVAEAAVAGGADALQLREKGLDDRALLDRARRLVALAGDRSKDDPPVSMIVNDRPDIAILARADGVHLGQSDLTVADARRLAGAALLVGVSTSCMQEALRAAADGADSCGCGPMFPTTTKDKPVLAGPGYLREYLREPRTARVPHLAIGGITMARLGDLRAAGCLGVAVSSAVCGAPDPSEVCRRIVGALEKRTAEGDDHGREPPVPLHP